MAHESQNRRSNLLWKPTGFFREREREEEKESLRLVISETQKSTNCPNERFGAMGRIAPHFSVAENALLRQLIQDLEAVGQKRVRWKAVQSALNGARLGVPRSVKSIKSRVFRMIKDAKAVPSVADRRRNRCSKCGQPKKGHVCPPVVSTP